MGSRPQSTHVGGNICSCMNNVHIVETCICSFLEKQAESLKCENNCEPLSWDNIEEVGR
jgi:hypothetical protein